jgi:tripartite-type tricarboxylate transporter receptor subunit TctC
MLKRALLAACCLAAVLPAASAARADAVEDFYKGKNLTVLIGLGVGGGNDTWARLLSKYIGRYIPGHPTIVPTNMPGAGGLKMTSYLYNAAPKDGTVIGVGNSGIALEPLLGGQGITFEPLKMNWIGSPSRDTNVCVARKDAPVQSIDDLRTKQLVVGGSGSGAGPNIFPTFLAHALGMNIKLIQGYNSTADIVLAVERNEVMGLCSTYDPLTQQPMFKAGELRVLLQITMKPADGLDAPTLASYVTNDDQRAAIEFFLSREDLGRPFAAGPDVPAERVNALRRAFDATMQDHDFIDDAKKRGFKVVPTTGEELTAILERTYRAPKEVVQLTIDALGRGK